MNPVVKASDLQRAMAPALLPNNIDVEVFATVLTDANSKREIACAVQQIRRANLFQERETLNRAIAAMNQISQSVSARDRRSRG